ncbi:hypothetical protein F3Y22_tig00112801pilonHSYRG00014 [Hibiscus syriacus]|uniref:RNase H type-1 domain-containing protein n=1 Tax=Hibiscus syriacus TaxID=106335 RepID=A0A6A2XQM9_HIBSY|nr:hypothetical protein F3Y22_tig00112801pilonHSYRG00014 [Hibiscus syriacus]
MAIKDVMENFYASSGHRVSEGKTKVFFSKNYGVEMSNVITQNLGFEAVQDLGKYLGVPLLHKRVTKATFRYMIERVEQRLTGWAARTLPLAGRITLAKAVLQAIPSYAMQPTWLPKGWDTVKLPVQNGGLGIKDLERQNQAFLMKIGMQLIEGADKLWVKVLPNQSCECNDAPIWKWEMTHAFSVHLAYEALSPLESNDTNDVWRLVWSVNVPQRLKVPDRWRKSDYSWVKINADGAMEGQPQIGSNWLVIRDAQGTWFQGFSRSLGSCTVLNAELWSLHDSLLLAWNMGFRKVEVETDYKTAFEIITTPMNDSEDSAIVTLGPSQWPIESQKRCFSFSLFLVFSIKLHQTMSTTVPKQRSMELGSDEDNNGTVPCRRGGDEKLPQKNVAQFHFSRE